MTHFNDYSNQDRGKSHENAEYLANFPQIFQLIDSILPLELCLHHEILPLELDGDRLIVGMVNLENENALNFIRPITTALGYKLDAKSLDYQTHQLILANYLKKPISNTTQPPQKSRRDSDFAQTVIGRPDELPPPQKSRRDSDFAQTVIGRPDELPPPQKSRRDADFAQTVIGRPDELPPPQKSRRDSDFAQTVIGRPDELPPPQKSRRSFNSAPTVIGRPDELPPPSAEAPSMTSDEISVDFGMANTTDSSINIQQSSPDTEAISLESIDNAVPKEPPRQLWQKLYNKLLNNEVDRLKLIGDRNYSEIIGYSGEEIELCWEQIELSVVTAIVNEIKTLIKLPPYPVKGAKKAAIEKLCHGKPVLVRIELTPTSHGEEVVLTAMRGKTLQSHKQMQIDKIGEQALSLTLKLEATLKRMRLGSSTTRPQNMAALKTALKELSRQLEQIGKLP